MGRSNSLKYRIGHETLVRRLLSEKTPEDEALISKSLTFNPNIQKIVPLQKEHIQKLTDYAFKQNVRAGEVLCHEGELNAASFFIVSRGTFEVRSAFPFDVMVKEDMSYLVRPQKVLMPKGVGINRFKATEPVVKEVGVRASFGDSSMMYGAPRWTKCTALEDSEVWVISDANYKTVRMQALLGSDAAKKEPEEVRLMTRAMEVNENLQRLTRLTSKHISELVKVAWKEVVPEGVIFMHEGDLNADACFIVAKGTFEMIGSEPFEVVQRGDVSHLHRAAHTGAELEKQRQTSTTRHVVGRGLMFGEMSMLYGAPRFATVTALEQCEIWAIDRSTFQTVQQKAGEDEMKERLQYLEHIPIVDSFAPGGKQALAAVMEKMRFSKGETLTKAQKVSDTLYVLQSGTVKVSTAASGGGVEEQERTADTAANVVHYFGREALESKPSPETAEVTSSEAMALILKHKDFEQVWERLLEAAPAPAFQRFATSGTKIGSAPDALVMDNLDYVGLLGASKVGGVELRRHRMTRELYALKKLDKGLIVQKGLRSAVVREKTLRIGGVTSYFISRLHATFNTPLELCILCEAVLGGELDAIYKKNRLYGSAAHTRFYTAGVIKGLEYLHEGRIVYRNLKPTNILVTDKGYPKITDMSLAKHLIGRTFTTCGTPGYMAPEIISGVGHGRGVDWWSLGVLVFELSCGHGPFDSAHPMEIFSNVMFGIKRVIFPQNCDGPPSAFIQSLLQQNDIDRLPLRQGGTQNLFTHSYFSGFDWGALKARTMKAPYVPTFSVPPESWKATHDLSKIALENQSGDPEKLPRSVPYVDDDSGWDSAFAS